jgi:hypothetical protein
MKRPLQSLVAQVPVLLLAAWPPRSAQGQGLPAPGPGGPMLTPPDAGNLMAPALILGLALLAALVLGVMFLDRQRKRRAQAIAIEGQLADALMREPRLGRAVITPVAHVPPTGRAAPVVEVRGAVEYPELRDIAVRAVRQELLRYHPAGVVEDRIFVAPPVPAGRR